MNRRIWTIITSTIRTRSLILQTLNQRNNDYEEYIKDKEEYLIDNTNFDLVKIYNYLKNTESINPHLVNPIYIKGIDALNGK